jgi:cytochrome c oxidase cbb3-type subunit III
MRKLVGTIAAFAFVVVASGCRNERVEYNESGDVSHAPPPSLPVPSGAAMVPEGPYAGIAVSAVEPVKNPYADDSSAADEGRQLFVAMNCTGCHGFEAKAGLMAPQLTDNYWRYGGSDADVFNSIYEGRAKGMPAWGTVLSHKQIWELVSYIRSLGGMTGPRVPTLVNANSAQAGGPTPQNRRQP